MVCFVMIRHVDSHISNKYWIECYNCIRKFYIDNLILIIDSNSNYKYVTEMEMVNTTIIRSEFKCRGEILVYYYYYKSNISDYAVIIQDSMFIKKYIEFGSSVKFLWHFNADNDNSYEIRHMINLLNYNKELIDFYNNKSLWNGCFGSCVIVNYDIIEKIDKKYNFFNLLNVITNPQFSMGFERLFALLIIYETKMNKDSCSLLGNIFDYINSTPNYSWVCNYNDYINLNLNNSIIKIWCKR